MPVRIRLSRGGAKKRPFYRIVVADSRRSRDGKFIDQLGTYNPMLAKDNPERVKINADKAKDWIVKGAQPSDRVKLFLSNIGIVEKPIITEKTKKHLPKKKAEATAEVKSDTPAEADKEVKTEKTAEVKSDSPATADKEIAAEKAAKKINEKKTLNIQREKGEEKKDNEGKSS